jgi:hypothetical protein
MKSYDTVRPAVPVKAGAPFRERLRGALADLAAYIILHPAAIILALVALIAIGPLLQPGYFWGAHDARHDVYFLFEYDKAVQEGNWFPRWGQDWAFGYGYPFWIIYAPLAVFVGELIHHFAGLDWEASVKAVLALSFVLSGLGMYGFVRSWLGRRAALVAAVAYMIFPYHLVDVFVRAALPESMALALFPFVLWAFRSAVLRPRLLTVLAAGLSYAALMWTHNLSAVIFTPGLAVYVAALLWWEAQGSEGEEQRDGKPGFGAHLLRATRRAWAPILAVVLGLGLSAGFFVPAILEARNVNQAQWFGQYYNPFKHFVYFNQLFNPVWGFGISQPGPDDVAQGSLSYQIGAVPLLLALVALVTVGRLGRARRRELWLLALWGGAAAFLTLGLSAPAWHLPLVPLAQFPWRYLMLAAAPICVLAGTVVAAPGAGDKPDEASRIAHHVSRITLYWPTALILALVLLGSYPYLQVEMREPTAEQGPVSYQALMRFQRTSDEMTGVTAWVDGTQRPNWSPMADVWIKGGEPRTRVDYRQVPQNKTLAVNAEAMGTDYEEIWYYTDFPGKSVTFNRFWYPGWRAYLLDARHGKPVQELPIQREAGPLARIVVPVPQGQGFLLLRFEDTPLRAAAKGVTYLTLGLILLTLVILTARRLWARQRAKRSS